jgi:multidrug efflux pump subunit AcrA (membrane-fusion protein)
MKHNLKIFAIILLAALSLASCNIINPESVPESTPVPTVEDSGSFNTQGNLVPRDYMYLAFPGAGHITEILVEQGDR